MVPSFSSSSIALSSLTLNSFALLLFLANGSATLTVAALSSRTLQLYFFALINAFKLFLVFTTPSTWPESNASKVKSRASKLLILIFLS